MFIKKNFLRIFAFAVSICLLFQSVSLHVLAEEIGKSDSSNESSLEEISNIDTNTIGSIDFTDNQYESPKQSDVTIESSKLENSFFRLFKLKTGVNTSVIYPFPVNFKTDSGEYKKYDTSLVKDESGYTLKSSPFITTFNSGKNILNVKNDKFYFYFSLLGSTEFNAKIENKEVSANKYLSENPNNSGKITYENDNVRYVYETINNKILGTIETESIDAFFNVKYFISTDLTPILTEKEVSFFDESNNPVFTISAPVLNDDENSDNIAFLLEEYESGYILSFSYDSKDLTDFPINVKFTFEFLSDESKEETLNSIPSKEYISKAILESVSSEGSLEYTDVTENVLRGIREEDLETQNMLLSSSSSLVISSVDIQGLPSNISTHTYEIGEYSGTAYVKDPNGEVYYVHEDLWTNGELFPVSVSHVFSQSNIGSDTDSYYGKGFSLSIIQKIEQSSGSTNTYVLTDGLGAKHNFVYDGTQDNYVSEEDGFSYYDLTTRKIFYSDGSIATFSTYGYLVYYEDIYENSYSISYYGSSLRVNSISDGAGNSIVFTYTNSKLTEIHLYEDSSRSINFSYDSNNFLTNFSYPLNAETSLTYSTDGYLNEIDDESGDFLQFSYYPYSSETIKPCYFILPGHIDEDARSYTEKVIAFFGTTTSYTYYDSNLNALYSETLYFDSLGRTRVAFDTDGNVVTENYKGGALTPKNLLSDESSTKVECGNILTSDTWTTYNISGTGTLSTATCSQMSSPKYGTSVHKLTPGSSSSEVYAMLDAGNLEIDKTYTLTADCYVTSLDSAAGEILLGVRSYDADTGTYTFLASSFVITSRSISYTFTVPEDSDNIYAIIGIKNLALPLYFDNVSLLEGTEVFSYNQVKDPGFLSTSSTWTQNSTYSLSYGTFSKAKSVTIPGSSSLERKLYQTLQISNTNTGYILVSGFVKGNKTQSNTVGIELSFSGLQDDKLLEIETGNTGWQFVSSLIEIENYTGTATISLLNNYSGSSASFSCVSVKYFDETADFCDVTRYEYDNLNRLAKEYGINGTVSTITYVGTNDVRIDTISKVDKKGNVLEVSYVYDTDISFQVNSTHESYTEGVNSVGVLGYDLYTYYDFDQYGNVTRTYETDNLYGNTVSDVMYSYSSDGNLLVSTFDETGVTYYGYNNVGEISSVTNPDGSIEYFTYDSLGRTLTSGDVSYVYDNDYLEIAGNENSVRFTKDSKGNIGNISLYTGNTLFRNIVSYQYNNVYGNISQVTYGNNQNKYYFYDDEGRLSYISNSSSSTFETAKYAWEYDIYGNVSKHIDRSLGTEIVEEYSYENGTLKSIVSSNGNSIYYDTNEEEGKTTKTYVTSTGKKYVTVVETDAFEKTATATTNGSVETSYTLDSLGRKTSKTQTLSGNDIETEYDYYVSTKYELYNGHYQTVRNETALVTEEDFNGVIPTLSYTYDSKGNITEIYENNQLTQKYYYDSDSQLVREDNRKLNNGNGYTIKYSYSDGNILYKSFYTYSPGISNLNTLTPLNTIFYSYNSNGELVSYNGNSITYDGAGNPTKYSWNSGYTLYYSNGNDLSWFTPPGNSYMQGYYYNASGLRTKKSLCSSSGSQNIAYFWLDNKLQNEISTGVKAYEITYIYDANGEIDGFYYSQGSGNSVYYRYLKNSRGDVLAIINPSGSIVCKYTYDSWGKLLSITDASGTVITSDTHIGYINPIRYRSYYYDNETGFYYLQSRFYDPETGRFLTADSQINQDTTGLGLNLYCYCGNNPVNGYDSEGTFDWNTFLKGASIALVGVTAIASVCTAGCAAPALAAAIAIAAGVACIGFGAAEIVESVTDYNVIRDGLMSGNGQLYNAVRSVTALTASISTLAVNVGAAVNRAANPTMVCFIEETLVATKNGLVPIEEIKSGDLVWATDPDTNETELKEVVRLFRNETNEWIHLTVDCEEIICTPEHPFYSPVKGWTAACKLRAGDILVTVNGEYVVLEKIQHELLEAPETTYNFEVDGFHTYYVGSCNILVHNNCQTSGSYEINFQSGKNYVGKGNQTRMNVSAKFHSILNNDPVVSMSWEFAPNTEQAFVDEYFKMAMRGVNNLNTYNLIWSPGRSIFINSLLR